VAKSFGFAAGFPPPIPAFTQSARGDEGGREDFAKKLTESLQI
jgi:hypothetical protein